MVEREMRKANHVKSVNNKEERMKNSMQIYSMKMQENGVTRDRER